MIPRRPALLSLCAAAAFLLLPSRAEDPAPNTLSEAERAAGWRLLFDGRTPDGWRGFRADRFPSKGWVVEDSPKGPKLKKL